MECNYDVVKITSLHYYATIVSWFLDMKYQSCYAEHYRMMSSCEVVLISSAEMFLCL